MRVVRASMKRYTLRVEWRPTPAGNSRGFLQILLAYPDIVRSLECQSAGLVHHLRPHQGWDMIASLLLFLQLLYLPATQRFVKDEWPLQAITRQAVSDCLHHGSRPSGSSTNGASGFRCRPIGLSAYRPLGGLRRGQDDRRSACGRSLFRFGFGRLLGSCVTAGLAHVRLRF